MAGPVMGVPAELIDYRNYRFGRARQRYRGPKPDLSGNYIAFLGASETYGKFVERPFPAIIGERLGISAANWGSPEAGPSFFLKDPVVLEAASCAKICVVTMMGAVNISNRLYSVFKRRNARVRSVSKMLELLYPDMDLKQYRFTHNLLYNLYRENPKNFKAVELELREAWIARMRELLDDIETVKVLLWMSARSPDDDAGPTGRHSFINAPSFVNREMVEALAPMADVVVEYVPEMRGDGPAPDIYCGAEAEDSAWRYPGQPMHNQVAALLEAPLADILGIKLPV